MESLTCLTTAELADGICLRAGRIAAAHADLLAWIAEFDRREGWAGAGLLSCAHWLSWRIGLTLGAAREQVRVARRLEDLPELQQAFTDGRVSYSKARAITRVAEPDDGIDWVQHARHSSAAQLETIVRGVRRARANEAAERDPEAAAWSLRTRTRYDDNGNFVLTISGPAQFLPVLQAGIDAKRAELQRQRDAAVDEAPAPSAAEPGPPPLVRSASSAPVQDDVAEAVEPAVDRLSGAGEPAGDQDADASVDDETSDLHEQLAGWPAGTSRRDVAAAVRGFFTAQQRRDQEEAEPAPAAVAPVQPVRPVQPVVVTEPSAEASPPEPSGEAPQPDVPADRRRPDASAETHQADASAETHQADASAGTRRPDTSAATRRPDASPETPEPGRVTDAEALVALAQDALSAEQSAHPDIARRRRPQLTAQIDPLSGWGRQIDGELLPPTSLRAVMKTLPGRGGVLRLRPVTAADLRRHDLGRATREVSTPLRELLGALDGERCRFPGCTRHKGLHAHHVVYWSRGGPTDLSNLVLVCSRHHTLIHAQGFSLVLHPDRRLEVHTADGVPVLHHPFLAWGDPAALAAGPGPRVTAETLPPDHCDARMDLGYVISVLMAQAA